MLDVFYISLCFFILLFCFFGLTVEDGRYIYIYVCIYMYCRIVYQTNSLGYAYSDCVICPFNLVTILLFSNQEVRSRDYRRFYRR